MPKKSPDQATWNSVHRGILSRPPDGEPAILELAQAAVNNGAG